VGGEVQLIIEPGPARLAELAADPPAGELAGRPLSAWRKLTRDHLGLPADVPIVATGHQTLLWHPGILAKYLLVEAMTAVDDRLASANLVVDQHTGPFGQFEVPLRRPDGSLGITTIMLSGYRAEVPMGEHAAFDPPLAPSDLPLALPSVGQGLERIFGAVTAARGEPDAAMQMAVALDRLMSHWLAPAPKVRASLLVGTPLGRLLVRLMAREPDRCARLYNEAVASTGVRDISPLAISAEAVELPLWVIDEAGRRRRATDRDVQAWDSGQAAPTRLLPRALLLTALVRVGMCDVFIHGTGGAAYDRAMELWVQRWLGIQPSPCGIATATLRLPLGGGGDAVDLDEARRAVRRLWHDPQRAARRGGASGRKQAFLELIVGAPRRSRRRRELFGHMHGYLKQQRRVHAAAIGDARGRVQTGARQQAEAPIIARRTWPFPLYPKEMIDRLAEEVAQLVAGGQQR